MYNLNRMPKHIISIKWFFVITMIVLVATISISNYLFSYYLYQLYLNKHFYTASCLLKKEIENFTRPVETFLYNIQSLVCCDVLNFKDVEKTNRLLMDFMKKYPYVTSINYGDDKGNGYLILNDKGRWLNRLKKAEDSGYVTWHTLNDNGKITKQSKIKDNFDPRNTIWYNETILNQEIQWSKEYILRTTKDPGVTASLMLLCGPSKKVIGTDIMIKDLSEFLTHIKQHIHPHAKLYLISHENNEYYDDNVIAFTDEVKPETGKIYTVNKKDFPLLYSILNSDNFDKYSTRVHFKKNKWFVNIERWKTANKELSLVILTPNRVMTEHLNFYLFYQSLFSLLLISCAFLYIAKRYITPLLDISKEVKFMGIRELALNKYAERNDEIGHLSKAISEASVSIIKNKEIEKKMKEAEYFESVRRCLGEAVHRFKDLINIIQGFAILAQAKVTDDFVKNALQQIINVSKRTTYLIKELLTVTGERKYDMQIFNLNAVIGSMKTKLQVYVGNTITIVYDLSEQPLQIKFDIEAFEEFIMNLISNAKDAMKDGGTITIKTGTALLLDKKFVLLSISDTGTGMDEETMKRIFEPFFTTKGSQGTGLGLSIVYRIIKDHEGFIEVQSELNKGTTFKIYIPVQL